MKIHIVQKGDTLWNLAEKYGVDFEHLKQVNSHLSNPDMLMPGMKIKIPTSAVPAKKEEVKGVSKKAKLPKKEAVKAVAAKEEVKKEEIDLTKLKEMVKKTAPHVIKSLIEETKPEVIQQIIVDIEMNYNNEKNYHNEIDVKLEHMPAPPKLEPSPPMPELPPMPKFEAVKPIKEAPKPIPAPKEIAKKPACPPKHKLPMPYKPVAHAPMKAAAPCPPVYHGAALGPGNIMSCPPQVMAGHSPYMHPYIAHTGVAHTYPMPSYSTYPYTMQPVSMGYGGPMTAPYTYYGHQSYAQPTMLPRNSTDEIAERPEEN